MENIIYNELRYRGFNIDDSFKKIVVAKTGLNLLMMRREL